MGLHWDRSGGFIFFVSQVGSSLQAASSPLSCAILDHLNGIKDSVNLFYVAMPWPQC